MTLKTTATREDLGHWSEPEHPDPVALARFPYNPQLAICLARLEDAGTPSNFVASLLAQAEHRRLSDKQAHWVVKLAGELDDPAPEVPASDLTPIYTLLTVAARHIQWPKVEFRAGPDEHTIRLSRAGEQARVPGSVNVVDRSDTDLSTRGRWFGRITSDGRFDAKRAPAWLHEALAEIAKDPAGFATAQGRAFGHCCFCHRELTDPASVKAGYGPICADHFGLPWGD